MSDEFESEGAARTSWHGMNQPKPKPKLPYYFRSSKRLKSLDEFEEPEWKGRVRFNDNRVAPHGGQDITPSWLKIFLIAVIAGVAAGWWLAQY